MKSGEPKPTLLNKILKTGRLYLKLFTHPSTPWYVKALVLAAFLYALFPADLIPDWLLGLGIIDDLTVVTLLVGVALKILDKKKIDRETLGDKES